MLLFRGFQDVADAHATYPPVLATEREGGRGHARSIWPPYHTARLFPLPLNSALLSAEAVGNQYVEPSFAFVNAKKERPICRKCH